MSGSDAGSRDARSQAEGLISRARLLSDRLDDIRRRTQEITGRASSQDETVTVVVDLHGNLQKLSLRQDTFRRAGAPERLAEVIMSTQRVAHSKANAELEELMSEFLPDGVDIQDVTSGKFSATSLLGDLENQRPKR